MKPFQNYACFLVAHKFPRGMMKSLLIPFSPEISNATNRQQTSTVPGFNTAVKCTIDIKRCKNEIHVQGWQAWEAAWMHKPPSHIWDMGYFPLFLGKEVNAPGRKTNVPNFFFCLFFKIFEASGLAIFHRDNSPEIAKKGGERKIIPS